ncbi:hypothetical protein [Streptomyces sp. NPDC057686]|uniref:hypothetical protein n=1 Tax=Streptomyces sp. NPDC057686 TaxID=3346212 RepID=UPI0036896337
MLPWNLTAPDGPDRTPGTGWSASFPLPRALFAKVSEAARRHRASVPVTYGVGPFSDARLRRLRAGRSGLVAEVADHPRARLRSRPARPAGDRSGRFRRGPAG